MSLILMQVTMKRLCRCIFALSVLLLFVQGAAAQPYANRAEVGLPYYGEHFAPQEYQQYPSNWAVTQDNRDIVYIANNDGVLEYDGNSWRLIPTLTNSYIVSLAADTTGRVYVGAKGDFGYLKSDPTGTKRYISLYEYIPTADRTFGDVWGTHATPDGIYFQAKKRLFRWDGNAMDVWNSEGEYHTSFVVDGQLYVREIGRGLLRMVEDSLQLVPNGDYFESLQILAMIPRADGSLLIGTQNDGLFIYDRNGSVSPFSTEAKPFLEKYELYHGSRLENGNIALATLGGGVLVLDEQGSLLRVLGPAAEIPDGTINYVYPDSEGGVWAALFNNGVAYTDPVSPLTVYDERLGLNGTIYSIEPHDGRLYVATGAGLFVLNQEPLSITARDEERRTSFQKVDLGGVPIARDLASTEDGLFVATDDGTYLLQKNESKKLLDKRTWAVTHSNKRERRVYAGVNDGLVLLEKRGDEEWKSEKILDSGGEDIRAIFESKDRALWLSTLHEGIWRIVPSNIEDSVEVTHRVQTDTLSEGATPVIPVGGNPAIPSWRKDFHLYRFVEDDNSIIIEPDSSLNVPRDLERGSLQAIDEDPDGNVWMLVGDRAYIARPQPDGSYEHEEITALHFPKTSPSRIYVEENGIAWIGNGRELLRYDPRIPEHTVSSFSALVRKVTSFPEGDVVYGGAPPAEGTFSAAPVPYEHNGLRFEVAAPLYRTPKPITYQFKLEGVDEEWSDWQETPRVEYADLSEGNYHFRVRARTPRGLVSKEASFSVTILPPWYRTGWAYFAYILGVAVMGLGYRRYRQIVEENKRAKEQAKELERERMLNERLQEANERLREANELKDNFLANTSHELRTPLTTILGFTDVLKEEVEEHHHEFLDIIERSGQRLMRTLNALLDLAKLRAGVMEADPQRIDVVERAKDVVRTFQRDAQEKGIDLRMMAAEESIHVQLDGRYLERVLDNLVSNAVKFTNEGYVEVGVSRAGGQVQIHVRDTGIGIEEEFVPHLFDDFKQESSGMDRSHEGSGLGLAISGRLVELMGGTIEVDSVKGEGSVFTVAFPAAESSNGVASETASEAEVEPH